MSRKRYKSVDELVDELSEDPDFVAVYNRAVEASRIVGALSVARAIRGLEAGDVDVAAGFRPGTTDRIERRRDDDATLGELMRYAEAVGVGIEIKVIVESIT
jgi:hypothetical protein